MEKSFKEFKPTSWSIDNKASIYFLAIIITIFGIINYNSIPKEQFPDIVIPTIMVNTIYPGTSPTDMENLVTRPIEKNIKSINGVRKITSNSVQDFSSIVVEFSPDYDVPTAKQKVKDAVDKTRSTLPNNLPQDPMINEVDISEIPIMYINLAGNYDLNTLKKYAEMIQDRVEGFKQITRVDIVGALDREIQINVDMFKMMSASVTFTDIERAISAENVTIAGGSIDQQGMTRSIRVSGEFKDIATIRNIQFKSSSGAVVRLGDIADVRDGFKEQESFARMNHQNVITLNVIKKGGENLLDASDNIKAALEDLKKIKFPKDLEIEIMADQSKMTRTTLADLNNTIIIGFILVTIVLAFFMGLINAIFVGLSVPLSMFIAYIILPGIDYTMNMLVMFSFIFALGIVVDDAIVVIENTHRIFQKYRELGIVQATKFAAGEVFVPILSGTLTTIAPFFPLAFWPGTMGKFMHFIPIVLIITLFASLFVAYIINPVFAVSFMKHDEEVKRAQNKTIIQHTAIIMGIGGLFHLFGWSWFANFTIFIALSYLLHEIWGYKLIDWFQHKLLPAIMNGYERLLRLFIYKRHAAWVMVGVIVILILSFMLVGVSKPKVVLFAQSDPTYIYTYVKLPVGTDVNVTDSVTQEVEKKVWQVLGDNNPLVESVMSNVAIGASENQFDRSSTSNKGKVTVSFVQYHDRHGKSTAPYLDSIRNVVKGIPGAEITVTVPQMGPPASGKPINVEVSGENIDDILGTAHLFLDYVDSLKIEGIEKLKSDFEVTKPEIVIEIDRTRANREGISTAQVGMEIRTAVLGKEISKYRDGEEQYPIQLRFKEYQRKNIDQILNTKITYRDMNTGLLRQIPLSTVAKVSYQNSYGGIKRKGLKRVVTLSSNVLTGHTAAEINQKLTDAIANFPRTEGIDIALTGENEDMKASMAFLGRAMLLSIFIILFILITQFGSTGKTIFIMSEVIFSVAGVLLGFVIFDMAFSVMMTGMGVVALAGIVVRNGILLVEFIDILKAQGMRTREAIIQGGKTRITPVLLTATATILGLVPLALGVNIDFYALFAELKFSVHLGGDSAAFFGPLAWTIVFGLGFATFLTLLVVPSMYIIWYRQKLFVRRRRQHRQILKSMFEAH